MSGVRDPLPTLRTGRALLHPEPISGAEYSAAELLPNNTMLMVLDQRRLPHEEHYDLLTDVSEVAEAIRTLAVRGAPAIGVTAAYGLVLAAAAEKGDARAFRTAMEAAGAALSATRPTAVNLTWAVSRMLREARAVEAGHPDDRLAAVAENARRIHREDVDACRRMGAFGSVAINDGATVLTHCNAGALATGGYGTALGVVRAAHAAGKRVRVLACETRPVLQGARLTAWELARDGIDVTLVTDNMVGQLFARGRVDVVVVGADRIAQNGDVANKIGTYGIACLAHVHAVPFDVAAPFSTVDLDCPSGDAIPIEFRSPREVQCVRGAVGEVQVAPLGVPAENPAFDVTPARLVRAIHTERGSIQPVGEAALRALAP